MPASRWHAQIAQPEEHDVHSSSSYSPRRASLAIRWMLIHLGVPMRNIEHRLSSPNVSFPPMQSFRKAKDEPAFAGSKHLQMFAFSLVHERNELFKLSAVTFSVRKATTFSMPLSYAVSA